MCIYIYISLSLRYESSSRLVTISASYCTRDCTQDLGGSTWWCGFHVDGMSENKPVHGCIVDSFKSSYKLKRCLGPIGMGSILPGLLWMIKTHGRETYQPSRKYKQGIFNGPRFRVIDYTLLYIYGQGSSGWCGLNRFFPMLNPCSLSYLYLVVQLGVLVGIVSPCL